MRVETMSLYAHHASQHFTQLPTDCGHSITIWGERKEGKERHLTAYFGSNLGLFASTASFLNPTGYPPMSQNSTDTTCT